MRPTTVEMDTVALHAPPCRPLIPLLFLFECKKQSTPSPPSATAPPETNKPEASEADQGKHCRLGHDRCAVD
jgi:hypothetical protein